MHPVALSSWGAAGGVGGGAVAVLWAVCYVIRLAVLSQRAQRNPWRRGPGGTWQQGADAPPSLPPAQQQQRREQARAYWEAQQPPESTLPAAGFIGDDAEPPPDRGHGPDPAGH